MRPSFRVQQARYPGRHSPAVVPVARCRACLSQCRAAISQYTSSGRVLPTGSPARSSFHLIEAWVPSQ